MSLGVPGPSAQHLHGREGTIIGAVFLCRRPPKMCLFSAGGHSYRLNKTRVPHALSERRIDRTVACVVSNGHDTPESLVCDEKV